METKELYLKTLFCCCACDGEIAPEEISLIKQIANETSFFEGMAVESTLNEYVNGINQQGKAFLKGYFAELDACELTENEQISLIKLAIEMIEADSKVVYSEIKFFKKMRSHLSVTDAAILNELPDKEDYLLPDIMSDDKEDNWSDIVFETITLS